MSYLIDSKLYGNPENEIWLRFCAQEAWISTNMNFNFQVSQILSVRVAISQKANEVWFEFPTKIVGNMVKVNAMIPKSLSNYFDHCPFPGELCSVAAFSAKTSLHLSPIPWLPHGLAMFYPQRRNRPKALKVSTNFKCAYACRTAINICCLSKQERSADSPSLTMEERVGTPGRAIILSLLAPFAAQRERVWPP